MTAQDNDDRPQMNAGYDRDPSLDLPPVPEGATTTTTSSASDNPSADPSVGAVAAAMEIAKAEIESYKDKALRAVAEMENYRRRADKEREDVAKYAITNFAREMLPVADNLRRALDSQPSVDGDAAPLLKAFVAGVELTERELLAAFERFGVKKIAPLGEKFDHNFHQAMFELEDPNQPPGMVVQVMQPGYVLKDRLLRPALVAVSKGGTPRPADDQASQTVSSGLRDAYSAPGGGEGQQYDRKA